MGLRNRESAQENSKKNPSMQQDPRNRTNKDSKRNVFSKK